MHLENAAWIEELYAQYCNDPQSIEENWRYFFEGMSYSAQGGSDYGERLVEAYRREGHKYAHTNPLITPLSPQTLAGTFPLQGAVSSCGLLPQESVPQEALVARLIKNYCGTLAVEMMHCEPAVRQAIQEKMEGERPLFSSTIKQQIFQELFHSEMLETHLHTRYVGQKRFSLEGGESLIPLLKAACEQCGQEGITQLVMGMTHRGRLNVLGRVFEVPYAKIFGEFEEGEEESNADVKYHKGYSTTLKEGLHLSLSANPSHLESVGGVVQGKAYAKQCVEGRERVLPVVIHGDAAFAGQGVVYELLQLEGIEGYKTGGTLHIVLDNQIGFTARPAQCRCTPYATDIALSFAAPIFHLNGDDPEACVRAALWAVALRQRFHCDVVLHLLCYRRHGHNESDEPSFTQPREYAHIRGRPTPRQLYQQRLLEEGVLDERKVTQIEEKGRALAAEAWKILAEQKKKICDPAFEGVWKGYAPPTTQTLFEQIVTAVPQEILQEVAVAGGTVPLHFMLHPKIKQLFESYSQKKEIDWGLAEILAFGTLVKENIPVRLSGQDACRGTFTHRHAVVIDQVTGEEYTPLAHLKAPFTVYNSPLSEYGVLGFEFGYSLAMPKALVLWEAQFGDFANGAQVIIDQYIAASAHKWQRHCGLVLLLPHGMEGQGSEHSSARLERYLQLCADNNLQVCCPTTPAQYFHLLRRQAKRSVLLPLIIMTPKGLLRHPECRSPLSAFSEGGFEGILCEEKKEARKVLCCTGRVYYDLLAERKKRGREEIALVRFEQLYPLPPDGMEAVRAHYPHAQQWAWVQEEPQNMGAANWIIPWLRQNLGVEVTQITRSESPFPATGSHSAHHHEYENLMNQVFA